MNYPKQLPMPVGSFPTDVTFPLPPQVCGPLEDGTQSRRSELPTKEPPSNPKEKEENKK
jgi:hypothetical protein